MTQRKITYWVIPPNQDAEFVANMEEVLEIYERPYNAHHPVSCMDEQPLQLIKETRQAIAATKNKPQRVDYEYERAGTASIFMFTEPLVGWSRPRLDLSEPKSTGLWKCLLGWKDAMRIVTK